MAYFAKLDDENIVIRVESVNNVVITDSDGNEQEQMGIDFLSNLHGGGSWKQTSYNGNIRKNYAGVGHTFDSVRDAFYEPQPFASWTLNEDTCQWEAPTPMPEDEKFYDWNEETTSWDEQ